MYIENLKQADNLYHCKVFSELMYMYLLEHG